MFVREKEIVPLEQSLGRINAEFLCSCPPGYPLLIQGEIIKEDHLKLLR